MAGVGDQLRKNMYLEQHNPEAAAAAGDSGKNFDDDGRVKRTGNEQA